MSFAKERVKRSVYKTHTMKQVLFREKNRRHLIALPDRSSASGFTLLEILVILVIAMVFSIIAVATYQHSLSRSRLQTEAIALASQIEQAESLAKLNSNNSSISQFRVRIDATNKTYIPEMYNRTSSSWVTASAIAAGSIKLARGINYGYGTITVSAPGQASSTPMQATEVRFNTRGMPSAKVTGGTSVAPPSPYNNAVYLTDGRNYFAVTVNILGRVQVWSYADNQWFTIVG